MRVFPAWIKTTLKEDKEIYRSLLAALVAGPSEEHTAVLSQVKYHHLDHNRDLRADLFASFKLVLDELGVARPACKINANDPETGSWYQIPGEGKTVKGKSQNERLALRKSKRSKYWGNLVEASEFNVGELDLLLARPDTAIEEMRATILDEITRVEQHLQKQIDELKLRLSRLL
ncbi:MAG: hypothetical protein AAGB13_15990 [Cyanobacteria bacterium P01_F01_bin.33]